MSERWIRVGNVGDIAVGAAKLVRHDERQIALFRLAEDDFKAVDNLCPHEGYPLVQGYVVDCVLTCAWHNFKFDLRDGTCVQGDEDVETYPVRVVDGSIEVDIAVEGAGGVTPEQWDSLRAGLNDRRMPRVARDVARLLTRGVTATELIGFAACYDAEYAEYGTTHAMPVAADMLTLLPRFGGMDATFAIMQAMEQAAEDSVRRSPRSTPAPVSPEEGGEAAGARFRDLVEAEDLEAAEALLRGALREGADRSVVEPWFYALTCDHFLGFGHPLIYAVKVFDLLEAIGWQHAETLLSAFLFSIGTSTREDTLPTMTWLGELLGQWHPEFEQWSQNDGDGAWERDALIESILTGKRQEAAHAVRTALCEGVAAGRIVDALSLAASHRMLRFDSAIDGDPEVREGWLDLTHGLTFAHAIRHALPRYREPAAMRWLFFAANFINRTAPLDSPAGQVPAWRELPVPDADALESELCDAVIGDRYVRPIVVAHVLKTGLAALAEHRSLGDDPDARVPLLAVRRFLDARVRERQVRRNCVEAIRFIGRGKPPRRLTTAP